MECISSNENSTPSKDTFLFLEDDFVSGDGNESAASSTYFTCKDGNKSNAPSNYFSIGEEGGGPLYVDKYSVFTYVL